MTVPAAMTAPAAATAPLAFAAVAIAVCFWIYADARRRYDAGRPVVARIGTVVIDAPLTWLIGSVLLWIFVVPLYVVCRRE